MPSPKSDPRAFLPLNPLEFRILLALRDGCRHGYAIVRDVEQRAGREEKVFPANLYRRIRNLRDAGLLAETKPPKAAVPDDDRQRKFFVLTPLGLSVARAEVERLEDLLEEARDKELASEARSGASS